MESRSGSLRIQHLTSLSTSPEGRSRFPKLDECAHFHYETVTLGPLQLNLYTEDVRALMADEGHFFHVQVTSDNKSWVVRRTFANFRTLDEQLHQCIYDRKVSGLEEVTDENAVPASSTNFDHDHSIRMFLERYLARLSELAGSEINCGPILNWLELDNRGRRLLVPDSCPINTPAVAAAYAVKRYQAQAGDEISFEVGDMISVIDMPPADESVWWRGKRGFSVGFFPCDCVAVIGDKVPPGLTNTTAGGLMSPHPTKPVLRKHGKLIAFFRSFILSRPSRRRLKQSGILKERVFGCDLGEHLLNSGHDVPMVLKCCTEFIESHGIVDGIYRLSGVTSNIQKLRHAFDEDRVPALYEDQAILHDIHSVSSLLKMYFRELPNPLCTYQLYNSFVAAVHGHRDKGHALACMRAAVRKLPPPHYRTLEYLMRHLCRVASHCELTGMTPRNIAIVWAPNLLRCRELEAAGLAALQGVGVQAVVTEFLVCYVDLIFSESMLPATPASSPASTITESISPIATSFPDENIEITPKRVRPKSLAISTPTKLLSLEEARNRALLSNLSKSEHEYIEVGGGPSKLPSKYHTVLDLPRKRSGSKRSPLGWRLLFGSKTGRKNSPRKQNNKLDDDINNQQQLTGSGRVRVVKSVESLGSLTPSSSAQAIITDEPSLNNVGIASNTLNKTGQNSVGHSRSVSHDSYFDHLAESNQREEIRSNRVVNPGLNHGDSFLELSEIRLNFDLEERELGMFSLDEVLAQGSGSIFSHGSPRIQKPASSRSQMPEGQSMQALTPRARSEEPLNFSVSPIRQRGSTPAHHSNKYRLEDRLCWTELRYIDSQSPESKNSNQIELELTPTTASDDFSTPEQNYKPLTENTSSDNTTPDYENLVKLDVAGYKNLNNSITPSPNKEYSNNNFSINLVSDLMSDYEILMSRHKESNTLSPTLNIKIIYENVKTPTKQKEDNVYEDVELRSEESDIYKDLKLLRRSVHEINELIDSESNIESQEPSNLTQEHSSNEIHNSNKILSQIESPQDIHSPTIDLSITNVSSDLSLESKENITMYEDKTQEYLFSEKDTDLKEDINSQESLNNIETIGKVNIESTSQDLRENNEDISMTLENRDYENVKFDSQSTNISNSPVKQEMHINTDLDKSVTKSNNDFSMETENIEHIQPLDLDENQSFNFPGIKQEQISDYEIISFKSDNTLEKSDCSSCSDNEQKNSPVENTIMDLDLASDEQNESLGSRYSDQDESMRCSSSPDRRRIDSEIGRDILREKKTRLELDCLKSREKQESTRIASKYEGFDHVPSVSRTSAISSKLARRYENTPFPPCVRARVAKNARKLANSTGLSISLDEKQFLDKGSGNLVRIQTSPDINTLKENRDPSEQKKTSMVDLSTDSTSYDINDDPGRRERIEKYKEERRNYLREKYRSESFRSSEKDELLLRLKQKSSKFSKEQTHLENEPKLAKDQDHREKDNPSPTLSSKRRSHESRYLVRNEETFSFPKPESVSIVTAKMSNLEKPECFSLTKDNKSKEETKSPICIKDITALFESKKDH